MNQTKEVRNERVREMSREGAERECREEENCTARESREKQQADTEERNGRESVCATSPLFRTRKFSSQITPLCIHRLTSNLAAVTSSLQRAASTYLRTLPACIVPRAARYRLVFPTTEARHRTTATNRRGQAKIGEGTRGFVTTKTIYFLRAWYDMSGP